MKWQARAAARGRFPLTSHPLAGPWECKDSIDILSRRNALLPARASKGNSVFPPTLTPAFLPSPSFWFPSVEFASSKTAKLSAFATRASGEREKAFHPWRHTKVTWTRFWALCLAGPAWPEGVWPDPCQPQHPAKVLSGEVVMQRLSGTSLSSACYKPQQATGQSGRTRCSSTAEYFLD